jgi:hypothetical protein
LVKKIVAVPLILFLALLIYPALFHTAHAAKAFVVVKVTLKDAPKMPLNDATAIWIDKADFDGCGDIRQMVRKTGETWTYHNVYYDEETVPPTLPHIKVTDNGNQRTLTPDAGVAVLAGDSESGGKYSCNCGPYDFKVVPPPGLNGYYTLNGTPLVDGLILKDWTYQDLGNVSPVKYFELEFIPDQPLVQPTLTNTPTPTPSITLTPTPAQQTISSEDALSDKDVTDKATGTNGTGNQATLSTQKIVCLDALGCSKPGATCPGVTSKDHAAILMTKDDKMPDKTDTYIVECLEWGTNKICTTGDYAKDVAVLGKGKADKAKSLLTTLAYKKVNWLTTSGAPNTNPFTYSGAKNIGIWESDTTVHVKHSWQAINDYTNNQINGNSGGQQQGGLYYAVDKGKCVKILWDPYGRVFDARTLEPLEGAEVTLLSKNEQGQFVPVQAVDLPTGLENPIITGKDGSFAFRVPDGVYRLNVSHPAYVSPTDDSGFHEEYKSAYSDIYYGGDIVQKGDMEHRDIPLMPKKLSGFDYVKEFILDSISRLGSL